MVFAARPCLLALPPLVAVVAVAACGARPEPVAKTNPQSVGEAPAARSAVASASAVAAPPASASASAVVVPPAPPPVERVWTAVRVDELATTGAPVFLDERTLLIAANRGLFRLDVTTGIATKVSSASARINQVKLSTSGRMFAFNDFEDMAVVSDVTTFRPIHRAPGHFIDWGPRADTLVTTVDEHFYLVDPKAQREERMPISSSIETASGLAELMAKTPRVSVDQWVWSLDTGRPIAMVTTSSPITIGAGGRWVFMTTEGGEAFRVGSPAAPRKVGCSGSTGAIDPDKPTVYRALGLGHYCAFDLDTGRERIIGRAPASRPPKEEPEVRALGDDILAYDGGLGYQVLYDAQTGNGAFPGWDAEHGRISSYRRIARSSNAVAVHVDRGRAELCLLDVAQRRVVFCEPLDAAASPGLSVTISASGKLAAVHDSGLRAVIDLRARQWLYPRALVTRVAFAAGMRRVLEVCTLDGTETRLDLSTSTVSSRRRACPTKPIIDGCAGTRAVSPDGALAACADGRVVVLSNPTTRVDLARVNLVEGRAVVLQAADRVDIVGDEDAARAAWACARGVEEAPFASCEAQVRERGLIAKRGL